MSERLRWWVGGAAISVLTVIAVILIIWLFEPFSLGDRARAPANPATVKPLPPQTEAVFVAHAADSSVDAGVLAEWRSARGDHKIIAYTIANCKNFLQSIRATDIDTMPRRAFSALMLDLTPLGAHQFDKADAGVGSKAPAGTATATNASPIPGNAPVSPNAENVVPASGRPADEAIEFTVYQQAVLQLSDAIARGRLAAASEAGGNLNPMRLLGWVTVGISAAATLFITIKSSMTAPPVKSEQPQVDTSGSGWIVRLWIWLTSGGRPHRFMFYFVGLLAMVLSAGVTALTSVKQFYDPTMAYKASEVALMELKRLHNQVALDFVRNWNVNMCDAEPKDAKWKSQLNTWAGSLGDYEAAVVAASATLQEADFAWLGKMVKGLTPLPLLPQPAGTSPENPPAGDPKVTTQNVGKKG